MLKSLNLFQKHQKYPNPLWQKITLWCIFFAVFFSTVLGILSFLIYHGDISELYNAHLRSILNLTAMQIDGDDLAQCIKSKKKSRQYNKLKIFLIDVRNIYDLQSIYILRPLSENPPDNMENILIVSKVANNDDIGALFDGEDAENYIARMNSDSEVTFFYNEAKVGNIYTAVRPIYDTNGNTIALLCADILINSINVAMLRFIVLSMNAGMLIGIMLVWLMSIWLNKKIIAPIEKLQANAMSFAGQCHSRETLKNPAALQFSNPHIKSGDEIEALSTAIATMCADLKKYILDLVESEKQVDSMKTHVKQMNLLAYSDALTGAGNKAAYEKALTKLDWDILAGKAQFTIIMADLNYLKRINDNFGHDCGNLYIKKFYTLLEKNFADSPIFRIGGDEFVVIVDNHALISVEIFVGTLKNEMDKIAADKTLEPWEKISAAIGIAIFNPAEDNSADDVFKRADSAMYANKKAMHAGRD